MRLPTAESRRAVADWLLARVVNANVAPAIPQATDPRQPTLPGAFGQSTDETGRVIHRGDFE